MVGGEALGVEKGAELGELLGEVVALDCFAVAAEGVGFELAAAGSAADAEVDAVGEHCVECAEDFGYFERGVVRQHDAAGADADAAGRGGGAGDEDLGRGAGEQVHGVVLGVPEARVAELVDVLGEREGVVEGVGGREAGGYGRLVEDREAKRPGWGGRAHWHWMSGGRDRRVRGILELLRVGGVQVCMVPKRGSAALGE